MTMLCKKLLCGLLAMMLLLSLVPAALADQTMLKVVLTGIYTQANGAVESKEISASFDVYQNNEKIGTLDVEPGEENTIALPGDGSVALVPVTGSYPAEIPLNVYGYGVAVAPGRLNLASIEVEAKKTTPAAAVTMAPNATAKANATPKTKATATPKATAVPTATPVPGPTPTIAPVADGALFILLAEVEASFELATEAGKVVASFRTDKDGNYALEKAVPEGTYVLSMTASATELWPAMYIDLWNGEVQTVRSPFWRPNKASNMQLRAAVTMAPKEGATAEPTAEPVAETTAAPTVEPTVEPTVAPTAEPTAVPTEAPTAEPTAVPTEAPTAEPTAAPTAEPTTAPTAEPTVEPTAEPTQAPAQEAPAASNGVGSLYLMVDGVVAEAEFTLSRDGKVYGSSKVSVDSSAYIDGIPAGDYLFTLRMPDAVAVTALNGNPTLQGGKVEWMGTVVAGQDGFYSVEFGSVASVRARMTDIDNVVVKLQADGMRAIDFVMEDAGVYLACTEFAGVYNVIATLPAGDYDYDDAVWTLTANADGSINAVARVDVAVGKLAEVAAIIPKKAAAEAAEQAEQSDTDKADAINVIGSVAGFVADTNGKMMSGVQVTVYNAKGKVVASVETGKDGRWQIPNISAGEYTVQYTDDKLAIAADCFVIGEGNTEVVLSAGAAKPAKISIKAFVDENNNGSCGNDEDGKQNVEISLLAQDGTVVAFGVTDQKGELELAVPAGMYCLQATAPVGYGFAKTGSGESVNQSIMSESSERTNTSKYIELNTGKTAKAGIGLTFMGVVTGTVWNDLNGDGVWQNDEPGIPGIKLTLEGKKNGQHLEAVTDEDGVYTFYQAEKGSFVLRCQVPDEYVFTQKAKGKKAQADISMMTTEADRVGEANISVKQGVSSENNNIGLMNGVIIEGVCFFDANQNGYYDEGEQPLPGVELRLARQNNNVLLQHVISGANGEYRFVGQRGSTFTLRANLPKGCVFTVLGTGDKGNQFMPNGDKLERRITDIALENGAHQVISLGAITYSSIGGRVYYDKDFSGTWERGEPVESGKYVTLYDANSEKVATKKTDKNGLYEFTKLLPGEYTVTMDPEKGYAFTSMGGDNMMQTQPDGSGSTPVINLGMGENLTNVGAGMIVPAYVSGKFFADQNDNGMYDDGERGMVDGVVRLMREDGEVNAINMGKSAEFMFSAAPGKYYLQYEIPADGIYVAGNVSGDENGVAKSEWFTVEREQTWTAQAVGAIRLSSFSGLTYIDVNGNSQMEADESPLAGVVFTLTPSRSDAETRTVTTGVDGVFAMEAIRPDVYTLTVTLPNGYVLTRIPNVELGITHGKNTQSVTLNQEMGTHLTNQELGCVRPASWSGEAYLDENYDGVRAGNERPAVGEKIVLMDAATGEYVSTVETDVNGRFIIEGIAPGEYELVYPMDEGNLVPMSGSCDFVQNGDMMTNGRVAIRSDENKTGTVLCVVRTTEISGAVVLVDRNGLTPIEGAELHLLDANGNQLDTLTTGADGKYAFKGLMPGDYAVDATVPAGNYLMVENDDPLLEHEGLMCLVEEAEGFYGRSAVLDLRMAEHQKNLDVVMVLPGRLGDKVWLDLNGNGLQDGEEGGIPGVTIELLQDEIILSSTVSDQYGYYVFENLYPAEYTLRVTWPAEVKPTTLRTDIPQISSVLQEDGISITVRVESNKANYGADLGFVLVNEGKFPAGYGEGEQQIWTKK